MSIKFYKSLDSYGEFSNFYRKVFTINGIKYKSSEHYYQSKKFEGTEWEEHIRNQTTPKLAAQEGRRRDLPLREDWNSVQNEIMLIALIHKFKDEALKNLLLSTENEELIEDSPVDYYWGCGVDGSGKNMLGKQLMALRSKIRESKSVLCKFLKEKKMEISKTNYCDISAQEKSPNFRAKDGRFFLVRCFNCSPTGIENYLPAVASGQCAWCGWKEHE